MAVVNNWHFGAPADERFSFILRFSGSFLWYARNYMSWGWSIVARVVQVSWSSTISSHSAVVKVAFGGNLAILIFQSAQLPCYRNKKYQSYKIISNRKRIRMDLDLAGAVPPRTPYWLRAWGRGKKIQWRPMLGEWDQVRGHSCGIEVEAEARRLR